MGSRNRRALAAVVGAGACLATGLALRPADATGYENADYLDPRRSTTSPAASVRVAASSTAATDPAQLLTFVVSGTAEWLSNVGTQVAGLPAGRVYATLGALHPWWERRRSPHLRRHAGHAGRLRVTHRCGLARPALVGRPARSASRHRDHAAGSIQSPAVGYHWAAQSLAAAGYLVLTWDPQGQGESETFGHSPGDPIAHVRGVPVPAGPQLRRWHGRRAALPPLDAARPLRTGHLDRRRRCRPPGRCRGCRPRLGQPALVGARRRPPRHRRPQPGRGRGVDRAAVQRPLDSMAGGPDLWRALVPDPRRRRLGSVAAAAATSCPSSRAWTRRPTATSSRRSRRSRPPTRRRT